MKTSAAAAHSRAAHTNKERLRPSRVAAVRGNTSQGGSKLITLETGTILNAPLFINEGDIVRINTTTGEYVERVDKK